ncbi:MAG: DUF4402 domain-containing protein [Gemmatimonadaceae bacterium]
MKQRLLAAAVLALLPVAAHAQPATTPVKVNIQSDVSLTRTGSTDFGTVGNNDAQTFTINPAGPALDQSTAKFVADGEANANIVVTFDATVALCHETLGCGTSITFTSNVGHVDVDNQPSAQPNLASGSTVRLNSVGKYYFWLGGSIDVAAGQNTGRYEGTFTMSAVYQ